MHWRIETLERNGPHAFLGFCSGYKFTTTKNLKEAAANFPQGIAICSSQLVAGASHVEWILRQAAESWVAGLSLANNKSIDLLMRISCQRQITKALEASSLGNVSEVVVFGLCKSQGSLDTVEEKLIELGGLPNDNIINHDQKRLKFLKEFHGLPDWIISDQLPWLLVEKSAGLVLG